MPVDFSQQQNPDWSNYAANFLKSFNDGQHEYDNTVIQKKMADGDIAGAQKMAIGTGNFDQYDRAQKIDQNKHAEATRQLDAIASAAFSLKKVQDPAQRQQLFESTYKPMLKAEGIGDDLLQHTDLSDDGLDAAISHSLTTKEQLELAKPMDVPHDHDLITRDGKVIHQGASKLEYQTITRPDSSTFIAAVDPYTNQGTSIGAGLPGGAPAPTGAPTGAPAPASGPAPTGAPAPAPSAPQTPVQGQAPAPVASIGPKHAEVASVLSASLPAPVVAGFMGNFATEGGYNGANGDGGSSHGIAQLNGTRLANFQRMYGVDPSQATPTQQAQFTLWEMQHPQAAGMTVEQRDAIMSADTPQKAAYLIDKYYERSDGSARRQRMNAAVSYASSGAVAGGQTAPSAAPTGGGTLQDQITAFQNGGQQQHYLSPAELKTAGYNPGAVVVRDPKGNDKVLQKGDASGTGADAQDPAVIDTVARRILEGQPLTGLLGQGKGAAALRTAAIKRATEMAGGSLDPTNVARYHSLNQSLTKLQTQIDAIGGAEKGVEANVFGPLLQAAKKDIPTGSPLLNQPINALRRSLGDWSPDGGGNKPGDLETAIQGVVNEYAKVMTGASGGSPISDAARNHAASLFNSNMSYNQIATNAAKLKQEMDNRVQSLAQQRSEILGQMDAMDAGKHRNGAAPNAQRTVVRTGINKRTGQRVVQYSDGSIEAK